MFDMDRGRHEAPDTGNYGGRHINNQQNARHRKPDGSGCLSAVLIAGLIAVSPVAVVIDWLTG